MATGGWKRLAAVPVLLAFPALAFFAAQEARKSLKQRARDLDLGRIVRDAGLAGRVVSSDWTRSRVIWFPRPALALDDVEARLLSGEPGPGRWSGRLRLDRVRLVPGWGSLFGGPLERIEAAGGVLEIGSDLLPKPPREYEDPIEGDRRPIPWAALLAVAADTSDTNEDPWPDPEGARRAGERRGAPGVSVRNLEVRIAALEFLPGTELHLERAHCRMSPARMEVVGLLQSKTGGDRLSVPIRLVRQGTGAAPLWEAKVGRPGLGWQLRVRTLPAAAPNWTLKLDDPAGKLAGVLLEGRSGVMAHLRWSGPCRMQAGGIGRFPRGLQETRIELLSGRLYTDLPGPSMIATGALEIRPGRVDVPSLTLRSGRVFADSAELRFQWVRSFRARSMQGNLRGTLDAAWIALAGPAWSGHGALTCDLSFDASHPDPGDGWVFRPHGRVEGHLDSLSCPWFADTLRAGHVAAWDENGKMRLRLSGRWGESPFRLEASGLPAPAPDYLDLVSSEGEWTLTSPWCRLEDFRLAADRFPRRAAFPFWLGLPGSGSVHIDRGMFGGVPFDTLVAFTFRSRDAVGLDSLSVGIAGGRVWSGLALRAPNDRWGQRPRGLDLRLRGDDLDLAVVQSLLRDSGLRPPGDIRGTVSGTVRVRWPVPMGGEAQGLVEASLRARSGSVRGLPIQEALRRVTGLGELAILTYDECNMDLRQGPDGFAWNRLRIDAPPLRVEGAGRAGAEDALHAVVLVQLLPGPRSGALADLLDSLLKDERSAFYAVLGGTMTAPSLQVVSRAAFLQELERLGGSLTFSRPSLN